MKKYALISVSDKSGIETLAMELEALGYIILSTSQTARHLQQFCKSLVQVSELTGFPEILDGRVKTLHPKIHGGILADRSNSSHLKTLAELDIGLIDVVAVNLYPFSRVRHYENSTHSEIIENIDIGGPTLIRAAAKNYTQVAVLTDPLDYADTLAYLKAEKQLPESWSRYLAYKAFDLVSQYDSEIAAYMEQGTSAELDIPSRITLNCPLQSSLRYGENPHQKAALYANQDLGWELLHGKELSFNNYLDIDAALKAIGLFSEPTAVIVKHTNPCGIGSGQSLAEAYKKAFSTDPVSPYGGIVSLNRSLDMETAALINSIFTEIIIAQDYEAGVLELLQKKKNRRLIRYAPSFLQKPATSWELKALAQGYLAQEWDLVQDPPQTWRVVSNRQPSLREYQALAYGWKVVSLLKSNAIVLNTEDRVLGMGSGQTSRIDSTSLAIWKAKKYGHELKGAVCASDGFFTYRDSVDEVYQQGITAIIQPGGSKGDEECIQACNELDMAMVFTGYRHFRH